jgi:organic hydroperoxide reductase OsmC/OhrA
VQLRRPKEVGGDGDGTNPEQLFAVGYAACFESGLSVRELLRMRLRLLTSYRRDLAFTAEGVVVTETSSDPRITTAIRAHAQEVSGFVHDGMPAMMRGMMGQ